MKICRIVDSFPTGKEIVGDLGPNYYYYGKLNVQKGNEEVIICRREKGQPREESVAGIKVIRVSYNKLHPRRDYLWGDFGKNVLSEIKSQKPDIVVGHNTFHFYSARNADILEDMGILLITHFHGGIDLHKYTDKLPFSFNFKAALKDRAIARSLFHEFKYVTKKSPLVIACDNYTKNSVLRYFPDKKVEVVYNGVDPEMFKRTESDIKDRYSADYLLLDVARPVAWKGIQYLLKAMKILENEYDNLHCLLIGLKRDDFNVHYLWLKSLAEKLQVKNTEFLDRVPYYDLPAYYSASDCFVTPSYPDSSPKTVYEAQSCNTPVVATDGGGIPEIFGDESGLLFEPRNVNDMVEKVKIILDNPKKFRGGREIIKRKATWEKCVDDMVKVYEKYTE